MLSVLAAGLVSWWFEGYTWYVAGPALAPVWRVVSVDDLPDHCGKGWGEVQACAVRRPDLGVCFVFAAESREDTPEWLRWHEELHCAGFRHVEP